MSSTRDPWNSASKMTLSWSASSKAQRSGKSCGKAFSVATGGRVLLGIMRYLSGCLEDFNHDAVGGGENLQMQKFAIHGEIEWAGAAIGSGVEC